MAELKTNCNIIVAGSRSFDNYSLLNLELGWFISNQFSKYKQITIVSGCAKGADSFAIEYANKNGYECIQMPADWEKHGKKAGYIRNTEMANIADGCICFWDGESKGTKHMIDIARKKMIPLTIVDYIQRSKKLIIFMDI